MSRRNRARARRLDKAVSPTTMQFAGAAPRGLQPRRYNLMDAINTATARLTASGLAGTFDPLPRDPGDTTAFGPLTPLTPDPIDPLRLDTGRTEPRVFEYQMGWNLPGAGGRETPWQVLRSAAEGVSIIRNCIEIRKRHVRALKWEIAPARDAITEAYRADPSRSQDGIEAEMRERLMPEIRRLRDFWTKPWHSNDWRMGQWINAVMEDLLVLDAVPVYPRMSFGGDVLDLEVIDGTTIKPLLDWRGARPQPPYAAFQQILYGFPRGEWTASATRDDQGREIVDNGYASGELFYYRENVRSFTPYGYPPVERALMDSRIWLKRFGWLLAEYEDGSTPVTFIETAASQDGQRLDVVQRRAYEDAINDELMGQTRRRNRMKVLPNQWKPHQMSTAPERYRPEYDLFVIKLISSVFGVTIAEHGFTEPGGLGSTGWHEGQAEVTGRVGTRPDVEILSDILNDLSRQFLRMSPELEFRFIDPASQNDKDSDGVADTQVKSGRITLNDDRRRLGLSLYDFPEADMPMIVTATGPVFLEGSFQRAQEAAQAAKELQLAGAEGTRGKLGIEEAKLQDGQQAREESREFERERMERAEAAQVDKMAELGAFRTWRRRNPEPKRPFVFKAITPDDAFGELSDLGPDVLTFGDDWEWIEDIDKYESWWPRDARGRWVRRSHLSGDLPGALKKELERTGPDINTRLPADGPSSKLGSMDFERLRNRKTSAENAARIEGEIQVATTREQALASLEGMSTVGVKALSNVLGRGSIADDMTPEAARAAMVTAIRGRHPRRKEVADLAGEVRKAVAPDDFESGAPDLEGDADPKAQAPIPPDQRWPGWAVDTAIALAVMPMLQSAMNAGVRVGVLISLLKSWLSGLSFRPGDPVPDVRSWLDTGTDIGDRLFEELIPPIRQAHIEGAMVGQRSAEALMDWVREHDESARNAVEISLDWGDWEPGHPDAARLLLEPGGLERLLAQSNVQIRSIVDHRMDRIGQIIGRGLQRGDAPEKIATELEKLTGDMAWARMTAITETNRAMSAASVDSYKRGGCWGKGWMTALDQRVCLLCEVNERNPDGTPRVVPIDAQFPSGDPWPPGHPHCRCASIPVFELSRGR